MLKSFNEEFCFCQNFSERLRAENNENEPLVAFVEGSQDLVSLNF